MLTAPEATLTLHDTRRQVPKPKVDGRGSVDGGGS
jgi:hypothetical protein